MFCELGGEMLQGCISILAKATGEKTNPHLVYAHYPLLSICIFHRKNKIKVDDISVKETAMLLSKGEDIFPEVVGMPVECCGCHNPYYSADTVCISMLREKPDGNQEMIQFLVCFTCCALKCESVGRC